MTDHVLDLIELESSLFCIEQLPTKSASTNYSQLVKPLVGLKYVPLSVISIKYLPIRFMVLVWGCALMNYILDVRMSVFC